MTRLSFKLINVKNDVFINPYEIEAVTFYIIDTGINMGKYRMCVYFKGDKPYYTKMTTPQGDVWECKYDYE